MTPERFLTIVTVLRDGRHLLYQATDCQPGHTGVRIGGHIALRQRDYGDDIETFIILFGATCTEHRP